MNIRRGEIDKVLSCVVMAREELAKISPPWMLPHHALTAHECLELAHQTIVGVLVRETGLELPDDKDTKGA